MSPPQRIDLKVVSEDFVAEATAPAADKLKQQLAAAIREGRRRQRDVSQAEIERLELDHDAKVRGIYEAHEGELRRHTKLVAKAAFRDGALWFVTVGMAFAAALIGATWYIVGQSMLLNTTAQRAQQAIDAGPVPSLDAQYRETGRPGEN